MAKSANGLMTRLKKTLYREANALFKTDEYTRFFGLPLTRERARFYMVQRATFMPSRPSCFQTFSAP